MLNVSTVTGWQVCHSQTVSSSVYLAAMYTNRVMFYHNQEVSIRCAPRARLKQCVGFPIHAS